MRDDVQEFTPDVSTQKAVTDWLMQVISGKKPIELNIKGAGQDEALAEAAPEGSQSTVAVEKRPVGDTPEGSSTKPSSTKPKVEDVFGLAGPQKTQAIAAEPAAVFSAEDLCGPPVIPFSPEVVAPIAAPEPDFTAEDLCGAPVFQVVKVETNGFHAAPAEALSVEGEHAVAIEDILRDTPLSEDEAAKIAGGTGLAAEGEAQNGFRMEDVFRRPEEQGDFHAGAGADGLHTPLELPYIPEAPAEVAAAASSMELETAPAAEEFRAEAIPEHAPQAVAEENLSAQGSAWAPEAVSAGENTFARENIWARGDIWGERAQPEAAAAAEESPAGVVYESSLDVAEPREFTEDLEYPEDEENLFPDLEELKRMAKSRPEAVGATWKTLLRLGSVLPWLARTLPVFEAGAQGGGTGFMQEVRHEVADLRVIQVEVRSAVQDHSQQLKRMDEQLTRLRASVDARGGEDLAETVKSTIKWLRLGGIAVGALLLVLILMVALVMAHGK